MLRRPRQVPVQEREDGEAELARREETFARIVQEHARLLYHVAHSLLRHPQDAEDAVQDALLKLYRGQSWRGLREADESNAASGSNGAGEVREARRIHEAAEIQNERAFLARVVWRAALDRLRARKDDVEGEGEELLVRDPRPTPDAVAEQGDKRALLRELIEVLPEELRRPLLLSAIEEMSSRAIGEVMDLPEGTVRTRLMRARRELKAKFEAKQLTVSR